MTMGPTEFTAAPQAAAPASDHDQRMPIRNGRYYDPNTGKTYQRVTNLLRVLEDTFHLDLWKQRQVARGLVARPDLFALAAATPPDPDGKQAMSDLCKQAMEAAGSSSGRNLGTALHSATERFDRGESAASIVLPEPHGAAMRAYVELTRSAQFRSAVGQVHPELIERTVVWPELGTAGTFDRMTLRVIDVKTEKDPEANARKIAAQLAFYAHAPLIWVRDDAHPHGGYLTEVAEAYGPILGQGVLPSADVGHVVHLRDGAARLAAVNLRQGIVDVEAATRERDRRAQARDKSTFFQWVGPATTAAAPATVDASKLAPPAVTSSSIGPWFNARYNGECGRCIDPIFEGDRMAMLDGLALCEDCAQGELDDAVLDAAARRARMLPVVQAALERDEQGLSQQAKIAEMLAGNGPVALPTAHFDDFAQAVSSAPTEDELRRLWDVAVAHGIADGRASAVLSARLAQVRCPQVALHTGVGARCACGWYGS